MSRSFYCLFVNFERLSSLIILSSLIVIQVSRSVKSVVFSSSLSNLCSRFVQLWRTFGNKRLTKKKDFLSVKMSQIEGEIDIFHRLKHHFVQFLPNLLPRVAYNENE